MIRLPDQEALEGLCPLGIAVPEPDLLRGIVAAVTGDPAAALGSVWASPHPYQYTSIGTGGLFRVSGTAGTASGEVGWSTFVKLIQHPRHWPLLHLIPAESVEELLAAFPWRDELDIREQVNDVLPAGLRVPEDLRSGRPGRGPAGRLDGGHR